jgi:4-hydroxy-tetrahydrodipicolinate synthase
MPLHDAIFMEPGVSGAKHGLSKLGRMGTVVRSPLLPVSKQTADAIDSALAGLGLI